jgi:hypothetical protein
MGQLEILNVQGGEVKLTFDTKDCAEAIRARRIIVEMIHRGFVLLVEVERNSQKRFERALEFDATKGEYIIADLIANNEEIAPDLDLPVESKNQNSATKPLIDPKNQNSGTKPRGRPRKRLPMEETKATAVGRSAGG